MLLEQDIDLSVAPGHIIHHVENHLCGGLERHVALHERNDRRIRRNDSISNQPINVRRDVVDVSLAITRDRVEIVLQCTRLQAERRQEATEALHLRLELRMGRDDIRILIFNQQLLSSRNDSDGSGRSGRDRENAGGEQVTTSGSRTVHKNTFFQYHRPFLRLHT